MNFIKKGITLEQSKIAINLCKKLNIESKAFFIIGFPIDTKKTILQTIAFAKSLPLNDIVVTLCTPIFNTELYKIAKDYGTLDESDWSKLSYWSTAYVPHGLTANYLKKMQGRFYREFYLRPSVILNKLKQLKDFANFKRLIAGLKAVLSA